MPDDPHAKDSTDPVPYVPSGRTREQIVAATIAENRRRNLEAGTITPEGVVQPIPPDGPIRTERQYLAVRGRCERFVARRNPAELDLNGTRIGDRIAYMEKALRMWDATVSTDVLRAYEMRIRAIKHQLRGRPWPTKWQEGLSEQAQRQRTLIELKRRVSAIYAARHHYRD